jgi:hypothetical protein
MSKMGPFGEIFGVFWTFFNGMAQWPFEVCTLRKEYVEKVFGQLKIQFW